MVVPRGWTLFAAMGSERRTDRSQDTKLASLSARYAFTGTTSLSMGWAGLRDALGGAGHGGTSQLSAMVRHNLSARTSVYAATARLDQRGQRNSFFLNGAAVVEPGAQVRSPVPGGMISGVQLGILHGF